MIKESTFYNFSPLLSVSLLCKGCPSLRLHLPQVGFVFSGRRSSRSIALKMAHFSQNPVVQQHRVIVPNNYGEKLVGLLHDTGSPEIVVLCHGFQSTKENETMTNLAAALETEGISVFRFDFAGNGESEGSFEYGNYGKEADDLQSVTRHFSAAGRVISGVLGHSKGGNVVLLFASKYHDVRTVVNVSGRYDLKKGISERLGEDFLQRVEKEGFIDVTSKNGEFFNSTETFSKVCCFDRNGSNIVDLKWSSPD